MAKHMDSFKLLFSVEKYQFFLKINQNEQHFNGRRGGGPKCQAAEFLDV